MIKFLYSINFWKGKWTKMKKVWKIILSIALIVIVGVAGTSYYFLKVKTYNVADKKVDAITSSKYNIVLPGQTKPGKQSAASNNNTETASNNSTGTLSATNISNGKDQLVNSGRNQSGKSNSSNGSSTTTSTGTQTEKATSEGIKEKYRPTFKDLEAQANGKIDSLIAAAISEYKGKKANGESISYPYFYQKYNSAGGKLESNTDATFDYVYRALQSDLKNNGLNPEDAKSFKVAYENTKKERESALLQKAKAAFF